MYQVHQLMPRSYPVVQAAAPRKRTHAPHADRRAGTRTSDIVTVEVFTEDTVRRTPAEIRVSPDADNTLVVEWEPPKRDDPTTAHAYQVRHRLWSEPSAAFVESEIFHPLQTRRICDVSGGCENPRRHVITGLSYGQSYLVQVRARNGDGWGEWAGTWQHNIPNGDPDTTPPVAQTAVNTSGQTTVVVTYDEELDPNYVPIPERFGLYKVHRLGDGSNLWSRLRDATSVSISGKQVTLTFDGINADATWVWYLSPNLNAIRDTAGNEDVAGFRLRLTRN